MLESYQRAVEYLLGQDSCPGASAEELALFKSQFSTSAYTCRLRSCPRATIGFEAENLRREHETVHAGGFRCTLSDCQYPPFQSSQKLKSHIDRCHSLAPARRSIRSVGLNDLPSKYPSSLKQGTDNNQQPELLDLNKVVSQGSDKGLSASAVLSNKNMPLTTFE